MGEEGWVVRGRGRVLAAAVLLRTSMRHPQRVAEGDPAANHTEDMPYLTLRKPRPAIQYLQ